MGGTTGQSVTLANSIIGVGILAMPFCFQQCGAVLAVLMLLLSGLVSRLACYFLLKSAITARRRNFEFLAFHVFGAPGKLMVEIGIIGFLMGTCIAYFVVVGDLGPQIISKMFNINQSDVLRTCVMVLVSLLCVLPLGLLRNVDSLSNVSAATIGFYLCLIIKVMEEAASQLFTGNWWNKIELWKPEGVLQCVPIFSMALFCQTQLFEIFETLPSLSLEKMSVVTKNALNICTSVYFMIGLFGYIAFCDKHISGNILVSLSPTMASDVIKLGFVMSLAFSFPLIIFPCRASLYSLLYRKVLPSHHDHIINHSIPEGTFKCITVGIIAVSLVISLMIPNIELVLGLVGSTIGVMICVIFPAACFVNVTLKNTNERLLAKIILCLGLIMMVLGTYANLQAAESNIERHDDRYKSITQDKIDKIVHDFMESNEKKFNSEDAIIKPEMKPPEIIHNIKSEHEAMKDSAIQPPNPVEPNPQSDENNKKGAHQRPSLVKKTEYNENVAELSEIEGAGDKEAAVNAIDNNKTNSEEKNINAIKDAVKDKVIENIVANSAINQGKLEIIKQQALIETIKQHGQEQKELIKEQKEILDQMKKTKMEIDMKKKENIEKEQVNKIAVESIQKIANIAMQSLTGVEKSNEGKQDNSAAKPEKTLTVGDPAEVLQKAVENIETIIKEVKPKSVVVPEAYNQPHANNFNNAKNTNPQNLQNKENKNVINTNQAIENIGVHPQLDNQDHANSLLNNKEPIKDSPIHTKENPGNNDGNSIEKDHVHSLDEPNSYVLGEDIEKLRPSVSDHKLSPSKIDALLNNVPLPIVMSQNYNNKPSQDENLLKPNSNHKSLLPEVQSNPIESQVDPHVGNVHPREKRHIDKEKQLHTIQNERKKCRDVDKIGDIDRDIKISQKLYIPEQINLHKVDLLDQRNIDINMMHHSRALKSVDESEKQR